MNIFVCFTGQGSQKTKMGLDFSLEAEYKDLVNEVLRESDEILGYKISDIIANSECEALLNQTIYTQPAIALNAEIIWRVILKKFGQENFFKQISCMAGHSVGEYNALCAAGIINFKEKLLLLHARAKAMENACKLHPSGMIALLGVDFDVVQNLLQDNLLKDLVCQIANDNGAGQIVLSGECKAIEIVAQISSNYGIKRAIPLKVSGAFHSVLMKGACEEFAGQIEQIFKQKNDFLSGNFEVISNISVAPFGNNLTDLKNTMVEQIISTVRWRETMDYVKKKNITKIIEIGPSPVLTNLAKKHFSAEDGITALCVSNLNELENLASLNWF